MNAEAKEKNSLTGSLTTFEKEDTLHILFSDENLFDLDGLYNAQSERIWAVCRDEADEKDGTKTHQKFPQKVMICLDVCSKQEHH